MVTVHVPHWTIEVANEMDEDGTVGGVLQFFTRNHCTTSFAYSVEEYLLSEYGERLLTHDLAPFVHRSWWRDEHHRDEDGRLYWLYANCDPSTPGAYPVTYVYRSDISHLIVDVCFPCLRGAHDSCWRQNVYLVASLADDGSYRRTKRMAQRWRGSHHEDTSKRTWDWKRK